MKDKRIGNDISVVWTLMSDGAPFNISGLPVTLYLRNMYGKTEIEDFTVSKNQVKWTFYGKDQKHTGKYSLVLVVNEDKEGMLTTDACDFVNLVSCSCKVGNGADECGVQTETIELTSTIEYVAGGGTISIEIDSELSEESTNPVQNKVVTSAINDLKTSLNGLSQSVSDLSEKVDGYSDDIADAVGKSDEATKAVEGITEQINGIIEEVGSLSDKVESLENGEISWTDVQ